MVTKSHSLRIASPPDADWVQIVISLKCRLGEDSNSPQSRVGKDTESTNCDWARIESVQTANGLRIINPPEGARV